MLTPIDATSTAPQKLAEGDLTVRVEGDYQGDHARIQVAFNQAADAMNAAVGPIGQNALLLAGSSEELAVVSRQLSAGAEETSRQAGGVSAAAEQVSRNAQAVATAVEEMSATVNEIAQNASGGAGRRRARYEPPSWPTPRSPSWARAAPRSATSSK